MTKVTLCLTRWLHFCPCELAHILCRGLRPTEQVPRVTCISVVPRRLRNSARRSRGVYNQGTADNFEILSWVYPGHKSSEIMGTFCISEGSFRGKFYIKSSNGLRIPDSDSTWITVLGWTVKTGGRCLCLQGPGWYITFWMTRGLGALAIGAGVGAEVGRSSRCLLLSLRNRLGL